MSTFDLRGGFAALQDQLVASLRSAEVVEHAPTKGAGSELNWAAMLQKLLPGRYGIANAFVVDSTGHRSEQVDLVVHDRHFSPLLFEYGDAIYIPAESVYAAFEVKQEINKETLEYAADKIATVRSLHRTSVAITHAGGTFPPRPPIPILGGILATRSGWSPPFGSSFEKSLRGFDDVHGLELGCAAEHGSFVFDGSGEIVVSDDRSSLSTLALSLLKALQGVGTVPAMDYDAYRASTV